MNIELNGSEQINASPANLWESVIDPAVLQRAIPGCISMTETGEGQYQMAFKDISMLAFWSMMAFLAVLTIGFAYEWKKGALEWE